MNGSILTIQEVRKKDEGFFKCKAKNGKGPEVESIGYLTVYTKQEEGMFWLLFHVVIM